MIASDSSKQDSSALLPDLRLRILSLLPPNDLALSGRLSCKEAAEHFNKQQHKTVRISLPLPDHAATSQWCVAAADGSMRQLSLMHKLGLPGHVATSGCEANVNFALQLLQPHVFPELLRTDHYRDRPVLRDESAPDVGSPAVASGLAHLLPSLEQRCPGLVHPGRTLEAAARHCDLAGLQAAWKVLGRRLRSELEKRSAKLIVPFSQADLSTEPRAVWRSVMAAAAASPTPDAISKMAWALKKGHAYAHPRFRIEHAYVCGAAAASGDLARVRWLRDRGGFPWGSAGTLAAVMQHANLEFIQVLEQEGGYLPPVGDRAWSRRDTAMAAAAATRDSAAKLHWLAGRVVRRLETEFLVAQAIKHGNWEALAVLVPEHRPPLAPPAAEPLPADRLQQQGRHLSGVYYRDAFHGGNLDVLRWMLQAGCQPLGNESLHGAVESWPIGTPAHGKQLAEALRLLDAAGWPVAGADGARDPFRAAAEQGHHWPVWSALLELLPAGPQRGANVPIAAVKGASAIGCEATLEALVGLGFGGMGAGHDDPSVADIWYLTAAKNGDLGTLTVLRRLGVPMQTAVLELAAEGYVAPLPSLKWLVQQGAPWSVEGVRGMIDWMSNNRHLRPAHEQEAVVAWLRRLLGPPPAAGAVA